MNRLARIAAGAVLLFTLAGCGDDSGSLGTLPTDRPATGGPSGGLGTAPPGPTGEPGTPATSDTGGPTGGAGPSPSTRTLTIDVWFVRDGALFPVGRTRPYTVATSRLALAELASGPSSPERNAGVTNLVPDDPGYEVSVAASTATVDLPASFWSGGEAVRLRQAQVVYTLTQFPTVSRVAFRRDGAPADPPVDRSDYGELLPPIVVASPAIGQRVTSPVTVAGTADVFEATVSVRILDAAGGEVATTFTTATCGTGCRGDYRVSVSYRMVTEQPGTVQVYEVSAEDGSRIHVVDIPVILAASR